MNNTIRMRTQKKKVRRLLVMTGVVVAVMAGCASQQSGSIGPDTAQAQDAPAALAAWTPPPAIPKDLVPTFKLQARVITVQGKAPTGQTFNFQLGTMNKPVFAAPLSATGTGWSNQGSFTAANLSQLFSDTPTANLKANFPTMLALYTYTQDAGANTAPPTPLAIEVQIQFDEVPRDPVTLTGTLMSRQGSADIPGVRLGFMLWRGDADSTKKQLWITGGKPQVATVREYHRQRYWSTIGTPPPAAERPRKFVIADHYFGIDDDQGTWADAMKSLGSIGINTLWMGGFGGYYPPSLEHRQALLQLLKNNPNPNLRRTMGGVYNPPGAYWGYGYADPDNPNPSGDYRSVEYLNNWAQQRAKTFTDAGFAPQDIALFGIADEPGWRFPHSLVTLKENAAALGRFREYLQAQGLKPADVGAGSWDKVLPIGSSEAKDLPSRRLFYWTMRFFTYDSSQNFANVTSALQKAFHPGIGVFTNWANFNARFYTQGPGNIVNPSADAGEASHDWFEFGRMKGGSMLWTEDWFGDSTAFQYSYYMNKLRGASLKSGVPFGGYVVGQVTGQRTSGLMQKALSIVGNGGKALFYYFIGPAYVQSDAYSETPGVLSRIAQANRVIAKAEDLLYPGKKPRAEVAILVPRSAQLWDAALPTGPNQPTIAKDLAGGNMNAGPTMDYMAEQYDLYLALQHANIPVDFLEEDDLTAIGLKPYKVLYVTEPNIPVEGMQVLTRWVNGGGTLATVTGAGARDRYNEPNSTLSSFTGFAEKHRPPLSFDSLYYQGNKVVGSADGASAALPGSFAVATVRGALAGSTPAGVVVEATWSDDKTPAIVQRPLGKGRVYHYTFMPGMSYAHSSKDYLNLTGGVNGVSAASDYLPVGFSSSLRDWIVRPVRLAKVQPPVRLSVPMIESPLLLSAKGAAVTLLNWSGKAQKNLNVTVKVPFAVGSAGSVQRGKLVFKQSVPGQVTVTLPSLDAADVLTLRPR